MKKRQNRRGSFYGFRGIALILCSMILLLSGSIQIKGSDCSGSERQNYSIYVDKEGVMRRSDTNEEVSYFGTNYTVPFAHAYRAASELGIDRKQAISRDVEHMARLGFNGFRLHLWDVELSDSIGNLLSNDHLDLLDFLIAELEKKGIDIILTAQTNFGNGYPERNIDTGAFSYLYDKCRIHEEPKAQEAQENYLRQLASHINPYTGLSYAADRGIIAVEINNEPCHSGSSSEVTTYINRMVDALRDSGFDKPVLYNVSHNPDVTEAYYEARIDGTTYQWYPDGLVAGRTRPGNFLPAVERYTIPWRDTIPRFSKTARIVYEFDPGDQQASYLYPAIVRTFRENGFQWITQFAYDPTYLAPFNTEYQTHFLNLLYTPSKAVSMMVAAEAARNLERGRNYGKYPADTVFGAAKVSYRRDLSEWNDGQRFYHSNPTDSRPVNIKRLRHIAGVGSSPLVNYNGTGIYFLDKIDEGIWRLELLPDVACSSDPFTKPSLKRTVAHLASRPRKMTFNLPSLHKNISVFSSDGTELIRDADEGINISPGVYLIKGNGRELSQKHFENIKNGGYLANGIETQPKKNFLIHKPAKMASPGSMVTLTADWFATERPDSVLIYPSTVSFWAHKNPLIRMTPDEDGFRYTARLRMNDNGDEFAYNIVTFKDGKAVTWPQGIEGNPLDWDFTDYHYYKTDSQRAESPLVLMSPSRDRDVEVSRFPESWDYDFTTIANDPREHPYWLIKGRNGASLEGETVIRRYVGEETATAPAISTKRQITINSKGATSIEVVDRNGFTFSAPLTVSNGDEQSISIETLIPASTRIIPAPYPTFLERKIDLTPQEARLNPSDIEFIQVIFNGPGELKYVILE